MILESKLLELITQIKTTSSVTILRADQMAKKPAYPYATYKEIISNEESWQSNIVEKSYNSGTEIVTVTNNELSETTISINVYSDVKADAKTKVELLRLALKTHAVNNKAKTLNMTILLGLTPVQDRTIFLEGVQYEYCFGFDFIIRANTDYTEVFESIEIINGELTTVTPDGVEKESLIEVT